MLSYNDLKTFRALSAFRRVDNAYATATNAAPEAKAAAKAKLEKAEIKAARLSVMLHRANRAIRKAK